MPSYNYKCPKCNSISEHINKITECDSHAPICCNVKGKIVILKAPMFNATFLGSVKNPGYESPMSGKWIESARARKQEMIDYNVVEK